MTASLPRTFVGAGLLTLLASGALFASFGALFPALQQRFNLSESEVGVLVTMISVGGMIGSTTAGLLGGKVALRWRILAGHLLALSGLAGLITSALWWPVLVSSLVTGVGTAILNVEVNNSLARGFGQRSAAMVSLGGAIFSVGAVLGPFIVSLNPTEPRVLFFSVVVVILAALGLFLVTPFSHTQREPASARSPFPFVLLAFFIGIFLMQTSIEVIITSWAATHMVRQGSGLETAARAISAFWVMVTLARFLVVPISLRVKPAVLIATGFVITFVFALLSRSPSFTLTAYILMGLSMGSLFPLLIAWMGERMPHAKSATAFALTGASVGAALFPPLGGRLIELTSVSSLPYLIMVLTVFGFIIVVFLQRFNLRST